MLKVDYTLDVPEVIFLPATVPEAEIRRCVLVEGPAVMVELVLSLRLIWLKRGQDVETQAPGFSNWIPSLLGTQTNFIAP